ncbi:FTR1 family iron permease [Sporolactobacillus sp. KGMB 08714]|uniref:FTR1 family iron permease n=1 Tax=Sporolactobacillus sp. KGMB 08714 TaxID=3064704 RepID=UPI002FBEFC5F
MIINFEYEGTILMYAAFLVALREGLEISLIAGIIFAYLSKIGEKEKKTYIWAGLFLAALVSIGFAVIIYRFNGPGEWAYQAYLEATIFFLAVTILTYMTFWMKKNGSSLNAGIKDKINNALHGGNVFQLVFLAFITVIREGAEFVMFILAILNGRSANPLPIVSGTAIGLVLAVLIGYGIYSGTYRMNLSYFFQIMGSLLIVVAAGLLGSAVAALTETGILPVTGYIYNLSGVLNQHDAIGAVLNALAGYSDHPTYLQGATWFIYLVVVMILFTRNKSVQTGKINASSGK